MAKARPHPPAAVLNATIEYLAEEDAFARWIEDCCVTGRQHWGIGDRLWRSWKTWAEASNERPGSRKGFTHTMASHGHAADRSQEVRGYAGINLSRQSRNQRGGSMVRRYQSCREPDDGIAHGAL